MAKCKVCGKKGLFLSVNKERLCAACAEKERAIVEKLEADTRETKARIEEQKKLQKEKGRTSDSQIKRLKAAANKYEETEEWDKLISVYEEVLFSGKCDWRTDSHMHKLVEYYQKAGQNDNAWALLNKILLEYPDDACRVRHDQYKILKKEKNYPDALKMYFYYCFDDYKEITCWPDVKERRLGVFKKEATILAKRCKIAPEEVEKLTEILGQLVENKRASETTASTKFKAWYKEATKQQ